MEDLFKYVKEDSETVLYTYGNTEKKLHSHGLHQFFWPGTAAGLFLCVVSALFTAFSNNFLTLAVSRGTGALGGIIVASSLLFYAMFLRQARLARATSLYITNKNVVWCENGRYAKMALSDITDAWSEKKERLSGVPFDMSMLEGERLVLFYRGDTVEIPYIDAPEDAARKIKTLVG